MSRLPIFLVLAVLLVLLGVMGFVVNPKPKGPPTAAEIAKQQEIAKKAQDQEMEARQKQMKRMLELKKQTDLSDKLSGSKGKNGKQQAAPAPIPVMDITNDWFHKHADGTEGLVQADALTKAQAEADRAAQMNEKSAMQRALDTPGLDKPKQHNMPGMPGQPQPAH